MGDDILFWKCIFPERQFVVQHSAEVLNTLYLFYCLIANNQIYIYIDKLMFPPIKDKFFSLNVVTEHDLSRAGKVVIIKMTFNEIYLP